MTVFFGIVFASLVNAKTFTLQSGFEKLDPVLRKELLVPNSLQKSLFTDGTVSVILQTTDHSDKTDFDIPVRSIIRDIATATVTRAEIETLIHDPRILRIESAGRCRFLLDQSSPAIRADLVRQGALGYPYLGTDVIVGIYDSGIDWSHPDFIRADGTSRILYLWDQTLANGASPSGFGYGTEYTQSQINNEIDGTPTNVVQSRDIWGHGTHVAGITAGNGRATGNGLSSGRYVGIAPDADLVVVKGSDTGMAVEDRVLDGLNYIFQKAQSPGRPTVLNLSLGIQKGPHDGSSSFEKGVDNLLGEPGRAIVVAAGNDGDSPIHALANFNLAQNDTIQIILNVDENPAAQYDYVNIEGWFPPYSNFSVTLTSPGGTSYTASPGTVIQESHPEGGGVYIDHSAYPDPANGDKRLYIQAADGTASQFQTGRWKILLAGGSGRIDLWLYESTVSARFSSHIDYSTLLSEPANARQAIAVGSFISRIQWPSLWADPWGAATGRIGELSAFSSSGPTRPNYLNNNPSGKPDITAPGETILSSHSTFITLSPPTDHYIATDGVHRAWAGTSMAAPHVTGLIALLFESNPTLTANQITGILFQSARHDSYTGSGWNASWGYGKADAYAAMILTDVNESPNPPLPDRFFLAGYPNPFNGSVTLVYEIPETPVAPFRLAIFDLTGRLVRDWTDLSNQPGTHSVRWDTRDHINRYVASGVYLACLYGNNFSVRTKLLYLK